MAENDTNNNMTVATPRDYWLSPNALHIERNAMGNPDYIQASCMSGAQILVYIKDVISYDAGHNYRRWVLQASPTVFNTHTEKYVYVAIPRNDAQNVATVVFPSELLDIYGKNQKQEQVGSENYYYIFLQGILSSSGDNGTVPRDWLLGHTIHTGYLSSDEAINAGPNDSEWYQYNSADNIVTFLKDLTMKAGTKFRKLFAKAVTIVSGGYITFEGQSGSLKGIANTDTSVVSEEAIVTPKYMDEKALSSVHNDSAEGLIDFLAGLAIKGNAVESLTKDGGYAGLASGDTVDTRVPTERAVAKAFLRKDMTDIASYLIRFVAGLQTGDGSWYFDGNGKLVARDVTTKNLEVTGAAHFFQLIIDQVRSVGGRVVLSCASCEIRKVIEYTGYYRVFFVAEDDGSQVTNEWAVGDLAICQSFNVGSGTHENVSNKYYWRKVVGGSWTARLYTWDNARKYYCIDLSKATGEYDPDSNAVPAVGDSLVQLGNVSDYDRSSPLVLSAYDDGWLDTEIAAPSIAQYFGVGIDAADRWNLAKCRYTWFARNGNQITGNLRVVTESGVQEVTEYVSSEIASQTESIVETKVTEKTAELKFTVDGLESKVSSHTTSISLLDNDMKSLRTIVSNHTTKIEQNASNISLQAKELVTVNNNVSGLSSDIASQRDDINGLKDDVSGLNDNIASQQDIINGIPLKTDTELAEFRSEVQVGSREIAIEVSEIVNVRRNMLMGTQFWKNIGYDADAYRVNGKGALITRRASDTVNGHNALEISSSSTNNTYGGIKFANIPVEPGKTYTISVWAKRMSASLGKGCLMIVHFMANIEQSTPTWQTSMNMVTTSNAVGEWVFVKNTITPKAGDYFVSVIMCLASSGTVRLAEPMMEASEVYTAWSPSEKDYAFVMGNLLPDSKTLGIAAKGDGITMAAGKAEDTAEAGVITASGTATATYSSESGTWTAGTATILKLRKTFVKGYSYVLSFYARRKSAASDYAGLCVNFNSNVLIAEYSTGVSRFSEDQGNTPYSGYMRIKNLSTEWTRYWVHVIVNDKVNDKVTLRPSIYVEVTGGTVSDGTVSGNKASFQLKKPKIEYGACLTEWTDSQVDLIEKGSIANQLHSTGINITRGTIHLRADNTIIDGDLHLKGVLVENYADTEKWSLVVCDMVQNKSVSVDQATVVLPMISPQTITSGHVTGQDITQVTVAAVKEAGVKLTIAAKYDASVAKWSMATAELYAWNKNAMGYFHSCCTKVFADPRIASRANYTAPDVATIRPEGGGATESGYEGGVFVCNGRRGRVLLLMPGQTLHLTSAIETINGTDHLLWYVDNGSEFVSLNKTVLFHGDNEYDIGFTYGAGSAWPLEAGSYSSEYQDSLFGARVLDSVYSETEDVLEIEL